MRQVWWITVGLFLSACQSSRPDTFWQLEIAKAEALRAGTGPEAALGYLAELPNRLQPRQHATFGGEYRRLLAIAKLENSLGRWSAAELHLEQCLALCTEHHDARRTATVQVTRFTTLIKLKRFEDAAHALDAARQYSTSQHDVSLEPFVLHDQGLLLEKTGRFEEAVTPLKQSLALFVKAKKLGLAANVRISLAWAYYQMGHFDLASSEYHAAQAEALPADQHLCLGNLGNMAYLRRDYTKAANYYHQATEPAKKVDQEYYAQWLANEATARIELHDWQAARQLNEESFTASKLLPNSASRELAALNHARISAETSNKPEATRELEAFVSSSKDPANTLDAHAQLSKIFQSRGNAVRALNSYRAGLTLIDKEADQFQDLDNKLAFQASAIKLNQGYVEGLMTRGRTEEAFEIAEASRARMLRDNLSLPARAIESRSVKDYREQAKVTGSAYLAYWIAPGRSYLWVVTGTALRYYVLPGEDELRDRVEHFQQLIQDRQDSAEAGALLFRTLIQPAQAQLREAKNIVIVPDGPLYGLNFETLRQGLSTAPYWIENVTVSVAPSLSLMLRPADRSVASQRVLLLGDATEWNASFPRLLHAPQELGDIEEQFAPSLRTRLSQAEATPAAYEREARQEYRYIHFATHATASRNAPLESAIILSEAGSRGKLTAREILRTPIHAELVSISACRSAGARTYAGEGLVGLAWAFLRSGAHSVVAGLWDVNDNSSPLIMGSLYRGLAHGESAPEALRSAKLELLKPGSKYTEPYYWGPFLLYRGVPVR